MFSQVFDRLCTNLRIIQIEPSPTASLLEQLPFELLLAIFKDCDRFEAPICKTLLPFTRAPIFKSIKLKSLLDFGAFVTTVAEDSSCGSLVKSLEVELNDNPVPDAEGLVTLGVTTVFAFSRLQNVWLLSVDWEFLSSMLLSPLAALALPQLETLVLIDSFRRSDSPWDSDHFIYLANYSKLTSLRLESRSQRLNLITDTTSSDTLEEVLRLVANPSKEVPKLNYLDGELQIDEKIEVEDDKELVKSAQPSNKMQEEEVEDVGEENIEIEHPQEDSEEEDSDKESNDSESSEMIGIQHLDICVSLDDDHILKTILLFPITMLRISDSILGSGLIQILDEIHPFLCELHIYEDIVNYGITQEKSDNYPGPITSIYPVISRFKDLQELTLSARVFTKELFCFIRDPLPLRCLTLGYMASVTTSDLKQLFIPDSPAHLSTLESLTLDVVWGMVADDRVADLGPYYDPQMENFAPYGGWAIPSWQSGFSREDLEELIELGEKYGIEVDGNAVLAIEVEEEFEFEMDTLNEMVAEMEAELGVSEEGEEYDESEFDEEEEDSAEDDLD